MKHAGQAAQLAQSGNAEYAADCDQSCDDPNATQVCKLGSNIWSCQNRVVDVRGKDLTCRFGPQCGHK